ncbi:MAG: hypothetical protein INQ03_14570 [Candidatus Heimdallarchaeota archaeon]|nr:hypothetical protein [Candidatus Heimdallarchaeota archaeon]
MIEQEQSTPSAVIALVVVFLSFLSSLDDTFQEDLVLFIEYLPISLLFLVIMSPLLFTLSSAYYEYKHQIQRNELRKIIDERESEKNKKITQRDIYSQTLSVQNNVALMRKEILLNTNEISKNAKSIISFSDIHPNFCLICKSPINKKLSLYVSPCCGVSFHFDHAYSWISRSKNCPNCKSSIKFRSLFKN